MEAALTGQSVICQSLSAERVPSILLAEIAVEDQNGIVEEQGFSARRPCAKRRAHRLSTLVCSQQCPLLILAEKRRGVRVTLC